MRSAFLVLALVTLTRAWSWREAPQGDDPKKKACACQFNGGPDEEEDEVLSARLQEQAAHLDQLEEQLAEVEENYEAIRTKAKGFIQGVHSDESRVERLEGNTCQKNEFSCGHPGHQCISALLACDKRKDCYNGADEDDVLCDNPAPAGAVFEAELDGNDPCTNRKPTNMRIAVLTSESRSFFTSVEHVRVALVLTFHRDGAVQTDTLDAEGYYSFGRRALIVNPPNIPDDNRLMFALKFDNANRRIARGIIFHEGTKDVCLNFAANRVD